MTMQQDRFERLEQSGFDLLVIDLGIALTLTRIAAEAGNDSTKRQRNQQNARHAYDTVLRLREKLHFTENENLELDRRVQELRKALESLGEVFPIAA